MITTALGMLHDELTAWRRDEPDASHPLRDLLLEVCDRARRGDIEDWKALVGARVLLHYHDNADPQWARRERRHRLAAAVLGKPWTPDDLPPVLVPAESGLPEATRAMLHQRISYAAVPRSAVNLLWDVIDDYGRFAQQLRSGTAATPNLPAVPLAAPARPADERDPDPIQALVEWQLARGDRVGNRLPQCKHCANPWHGLPSATCAGVGAGDLVLFRGTAAGSDSLFVIDTVTFTTGGSIRLTLVLPDRPEIVLSGVDRWAVVPTGWRLPWPPATDSTSD